MAALNLILGENFPLIVNIADRLGTTEDSMRTCMQRL